MCHDRITTVLEDILACVEARYAECDADGFCRSGVVGGSVAWDDCCDCGTGNGQLWVRLITWIPDPDIEPVGPTGCDQPTVLTVGVGALRCVPTLDEQGHPPTSAEEAEAAARINLDAQLIHSGVMCCTPERNWQGFTVLGSEGGCGGGEHVYTIPFHNCICGTDDSPGGSPGGSPGS